MARCTPCPDCRNQHDRALSRIEVLEAKLHAAEVERDAAKVQLQIQDTKLDAANAALDAYRRDL